MLPKNNYNKTILTKINYNKTILTFFFLLCLFGADPCSMTTKITILASIIRRMLKEEITLKQTGTPWEILLVSGWPGTWARALPAAATHAAGSECSPTAQHANRTPPSTKIGSSPAGPLPALHATAPGLEAPRGGSPLGHAQRQCPACVRAL